MRKLFIEKADNTIRLTGDDHKHLSLVLRCKAGDEITICTGDGFDYSYVVSLVSRTETTLVQSGKTKNLSEPIVRLTLFSAVCKGDKNDNIVRSCTEIGVTEFVPILTEFTAARAESYKTERLQKIAEEAAKQSGRGRVPQVFPPIVFSELLTKLSCFDSVVFPYELAVGCDIQTHLRKCFSNQLLPIKNIAVIVGSEGGFSKNEAEILCESGVIPVTLGKRILRADTACAAVCSVVLYEAGEMK